MVIPDKQEIYKIDLDGFKADQYELFYIEKDVTFIGEFESNRLQYQLIK